MKVTVTNEQLAERARQIFKQHRPRTPERAAAVACWVALTDTKTVASARRALLTFGDERTQAAAAELLDELIATTATTEETAP